MRYSYLMKKYNFNSCKKSVKNDNGYTLIELLAIIVVLSLIIGIVIVFANGIINNAKEKSYRVTAGNVESVASSYAIENHMKHEWILSEELDNKEYFCVSVEDLIDTGFLKNDVLNSYIAKDTIVNKNDYIYLERDIMSKAITKNLLVSYHKGIYGNYCGDYSTGVDIEFIEEPSGWAREKTLTIKYKIFNLIDNMSTYKYRYEYKDEIGNIVKDIDNKNFNNLVETEVIDNIISNGIVDAYVNVLDLPKKHIINKIDRETPLIQLSIDGNGKEYAKSRNVTIGLIDYKSGLKNGSYKIKYDWSMEEKSCNELTNSIVIDVNDNKSNIVSKDVIISGYTGKGKLYVCGENISDNVGNITSEIKNYIDLYLDNDKPIITLGNYNGNNIVSKSVTIPILINDKDSGIKNNSFVRNDIDVLVGNKEVIDGVTLTSVDGNIYNLKINSLLNGKIVLKIENNKILDNAENGNDLVELDTGLTFSNTYKIIYNSNGGTGGPTTQEKKHGETMILSSDKPTKIGYTFEGWKDSAGREYKSGDSYTDDKNDTLYAVWKLVSPLNSYKCANKTVGSSPYLFTYTGNCKVIDDGNGDWRVKFLTSGNFNSAIDIIIDAFLVGGGGGGHGAGWSNKAYAGGGGGGGGYTLTTLVSIKSGQNYPIVIGEGGKPNKNGDSTTAFNVIATGGSGGVSGRGGNGGSGGGGGGINDEVNGGKGGENGGNGGNGNYGKGTGQGTTTREFGESSGTLYAGGGGGGAGWNNDGSGHSGAGGSGGGGKGGKPGVNGGANTGGGGGGGKASWSSGGSGGSGIVVIRKSKNTTEISVDFDYSGSYIYLDDGNGNWRVKFLTSGTLKLHNDLNVDMFLVGGGGGGDGTSEAYSGGGGGGGGYTLTQSTTLSSKKEYIITIGVGGDEGMDGGKTKIGYDSTVLFQVNGGKGANARNGGNGGSGGGGGGMNGNYDGGKGGADGSAGSKSVGEKGLGQGTTTREFGESTGTLYAGGGGGGGGWNNDGSSSPGSGGSGGGAPGGKSGGNGMMNTGGGGGGGSADWYGGGKGGSGILIIRNKR